MSDFRNHLSTADQEGRRRWLYPRKVSGRFFRARTWLSWLLLAIMFAGPFIRINGNPLLLINIVERKFVILGQIFWPQDMFMFAVALLIFRHQHPRVHRGLWPAVVRLDLPPDGADGNGLSQARVSHRRRLASATRPGQGTLDRG